MPELIVRKWDGPYSFMVFQEYGLWKARRGDTGEVQFEDPSANVVLQNAVNSIQPGGTIFLKNAVSEFSDTLIARNIRLVGEDEATIIKLRNGINKDLIRPEGWVILENLVLDGNNQNNTEGTLVKSVNTGSLSSLKLKNCKMRYYCSKGVHIEETAAKVIVEECEVKYADTLPSSKLHGWGLHLNSNIAHVKNSEFYNIPNDAFDIYGEDVLIDANIINGTSDGGMHISPTSIFSTIKITKNTVLNTYNNKAIGVGRDDGLIYAYGPIVKGNYVRNIKGPGVMLQYVYDADVEGNVIKDTVSGGGLDPTGIVFLHDVQRSTVVGNKINNVAGIGIYVLGNNHNIESNTFESPGSHAVQLYKVEDSIIESNVIRNLATGRHAILFQSTPLRCIVVKNHIYKVTMGMYVVGDNHTIKGNIINTTESTGIQLSNVNKSVITENEVLNVAGGYNGIWEQAGDYNIIKNNIATVVTTGANTIAADNISP